MQDRPYEESLFEDSIEVHGIDWIFVFAYFDETGIHKKATDTVVAGYLFHKNGAKLFRKMFQENVLPLLPPDKNGIRIFHARKCVNGYDQFASLSKPEEREHIVDLMVDCIIKSAALGIVIGMEKEEYKKAIDHSPNLRPIAGDEYSVCLVGCIESLSAWLDKKEIAGRIEYVFEAGCVHQNEAAVILNKTSQSPELKKRYHWYDYSFRDKSLEVPQLFAADLLAWEWQRARFNSLNPQYGEWRLTLDKLVRHVPHIQSYETATSIGIRAMINMFYGVTSQKEMP